MRTDYAEQAAQLLADWNPDDPRANPMQVPTRLLALAMLELAAAINRRAD